MIESSKSPSLLYQDFLPDCGTYCPTAICSLPDFNIDDVLYHMRQYTGDFQPVNEQNSDARRVASCMGLNLAWSRSMSYVWSRDFIDIRWLGARRDIVLSLNAVVKVRRACRQQHHRFDRWIFHQRLSSLNFAKSATNDYFRLDTASKFPASCHYCEAIPETISHVSNFHLHRVIGSSSLFLGCPRTEAFELYWRSLVYLEVVRKRLWRATQRLCGTSQP